jgi:hypothetical protein
MRTALLNDIRELDEMGTLICVSHSLPVRDAITPYFATDQRFRSAIEAFRAVAKTHQAA